MSPIQQMLLGAGAVATKTYVDDIFSTFLYKGNNSTNTLNTGLDMSGKGGLLWVKSRSNRSHQWFDTVRGVNKHIHSDTDAAEVTTSAMNQNFTSTGFTFNNTYTDLNDINGNYSSWSFRKAPGFFTIKEFSGSNSAQTLSHDLGCVPGLILVKRTDSAGDWMVYHKAGGATGYLKLNTSTALATGSGVWNSTSPTSTTFSVEGNNTFVNQSGGTFIAYLFAGGKSTTDKAVDFDGSDYLQIASSSDLSSGTGDFTFEAWVYGNSGTSSTSQCIYDNRSGTGSNSTGFFLGRMSAHSGNIELYSAGGYRNENGDSFAEESWTHVAVVRSSGVIKLYLNGKKSGDSYTTSSNYSNTTARIGSGTGGSDKWQGQISNVRFVKGQALYTTDFSVPHDPFTTTSQGAYSSNVKLICCNGSTTTASTVTPATITAGGDPTITTNNSIFDDAAANVFGENEDQNVIKCGSHSNSAAENIRIYTGWEPQWVMTKNASVSSNWAMFDCMRGMFVDVDMPSLAADVNNAENGVLGANKFIFPQPDGFTMKSGGTAINPGNGNTILYIAIRRADGYVGKPVELGTDVFAMDSSGAGTPGPSFVSNFPVDFGLTKKPAASQNWYTGLRLLGSKYLATNTSGDANTDAEMAWDYNNGFVDGNFFGNSANQGWMWKRHTGFDVVAYDGNGVTGRQIPHSMSVAPEMMWVKRTNANENWYVYHKGHNGGSSPEHWFTSINTNGVEQDHGPAWNDTVPTSTHFTLGADTAVNSGGTTRYIACLFASTAVSKVGYYAGSNSSQTITTGFQPRFLLIKMIDDSGGDWIVFDTTRGWGSGNDNYIRLNENSGQSSYDFGAPTSTGFTLVGNATGINMSPYNFIYYAHA